MAAKVYKSYMIDTENTGPKWEKLISSVNKSDRIVLFYTAHSTTVSMGALDEIISGKKRLELIRSGIGTNALDMAIIIEIAQEIERLKDTCDTHEFIIVSDDKGYDSAILHFNKINEHITVSRMPVYPMIHDPVKPVSKSDKTPSEGAKPRVEKLSDAKKHWREIINTYPNVKANDIDYCINCLSQVMGLGSLEQRRRKFYNSLSELIKDKHQLKAVYNRVKPAIRDITESGPLI